jgi:hypothetical protein
VDRQAMQTRWRKPLHDCFITPKHCFGVIKQSL